MNLFIYILKYFLLVSSFPLLRFSLRQGSLSARGIGMGWAQIYGECIPTSESIKVKRLNWILCHKGLDVVAGKSNWQATPTDSKSKQRRQRQFEFFGLIINAWCFGDFICIFLRSGKNKKNKKSKKNNTKEKKKKKVNNSNNKVGDIV